MGRRTNIQWMNIRSNGDLFIQYYAPLQGMLDDVVVGQYRLKPLADGSYVTGVVTDVLKSGYRMTDWSLNR